MITLEKKERSEELNALNRILVDFKSLVGNYINFIIYKSKGLIYYIFDEDGFFQVVKKSNFTFLEQSLKENEYYRVKYDALKYVTGLKKSEVSNIYYDDKCYYIETALEGDFSKFNIEKRLDHQNIYKDIVYKTSKEMLASNFIKVSYDPKRQVLISEDNATIYPYKITFSDDINFKLKIDKPNSAYYMRLLNDGVFIQIVTISEYKEIYEAQSIIFVFNYLNNREI